MVRRRASTVSNHDGTNPLTTLPYPSKNPPSTVTTLPVM